MITAAHHLFEDRVIPLAHGRSITLGRKALIMGILNVTPDSFSDGGLFSSVDAAVAAAKAMADAGAAIIDIGGESTRPGATPVDAAEEQRRVLPVIEALSGEAGLILSIDTWRAETARLAVSAGAHIVNDVWGLQREPEIARVAAQTGAGVVAMHTGRGREVLADPIADQLAWFERSLAVADAAGVERGRIVLDPGFGFAKETVEANLSLISRFDALHGLGLPLLAGTSRKRFLGAISGREAAERDVATAATSVILRLAGASVFRVHDVAANRDALSVADALIAYELDGRAP
jgi:dihydropteroate synthase